MATDREVLQHRRGESLIWTLADEILQDVLARLSDRVDRQSWCLVCKKFLFLEAVGRKYVHLMRPEILEPVLKRCSQVEHLDLSSCVKVTDACLATVAKLTSKRLLSIKLVRTKGFGGAGIRSLVECSLLQDVDLTFCTAVGDYEVVAISELEHLQKLKLTACRNVTDVGLSALRRCKDLRNLSLKFCTGVGDDGVRNIAAGCSLLQVIDLSFTEVSDAGLASLPLLENLECLSLISCNNVTDKGLDCLRIGCKPLQKLDVAKCSNVSSHGIIGLASGSVQLQELNLSYCKAISSLLFTSLQTLKTLRVIKLDGCAIGEANLSLIGRGCKELKELSLSKCQGVTDVGVVGVVTACPGLQKLDLTCCREITDATLEAIATNCKGLLSLKIENCLLVSAEGLILIGRNCFSLEELDLTDCNLNDNGLKSIARCTGLRVLKVGYCMDITNAGLVSIGTTCKSLREFDCYRSVGISDGGVAAIASCGRRLKVVNMSYCASITDESLHALAQLRDLLQLELRACGRVTSVGISYIGASCKHLRELDVKRCTFVGDPGVLAISRGCRNLRQINLSYTAVTDLGMMAVANMSCLQDMKLVHMKNVSDNCFARTLQACGSLRKVKLLTGLRMTLPPEVISQLEERGTRLRWMEKPA